jgi:iron-sulfur cluster assembly accessory protein
MADDESNKLRFAWQADDRVVKEIDRRVGRPPRGTSFLKALGGDAKPPRWMSKDDPTMRIYEHQARIVRDGEVRWAHVVHANSTIWTPGKEDHGAQVVYAPPGNVSLADLNQIAKRLFALKGTKPDDLDELELANMLSDELQRALDWVVPPSLTGGREIVTTIVILPREQMPGGLLAISCFPIFADPTTKMATLVPSVFWSADMRDDWQRTADQVTQQFYAPQPPQLPPEKSAAGEAVFVRAVELTPAAGARVRQILHEQKIKYGRLHVRVVEQQGGFAYDLKFIKEKPDPQRQYTYESEGVPIVIDRDHVEYLNGTWIDFRNNGKEWGFAFDNPNLKRG